MPPIIVSPTGQEDKVFFHNLLHGFTQLGFEIEVVGSANQLTPCAVYRQSVRGKPRQLILAVLDELSQETRHPEK